MALLSGGLLPLCTAFIFSTSYPSLLSVPLLLWSLLPFIAPVHWATDPPIVCAAETAVGGKHTSMVSVTASAGAGAAAGAAAATTGSAVGDRSVWRGIFSRRRRGVDDDGGVADGRSADGGGGGGGGGGGDAAAAANETHTHHEENATTAEPVATFSREGSTDAPSKHTNERSSSANEGAATDDTGAGSLRRNVTKVLMVDRCRLIR